MIRAICVLAVLLAAGCALQPEQAQDARIAFAGNADRFIVVTLHNRHALVPRAGSTRRDYDSNLGYGVSAIARREVRALAADYRLREVDGWPIQALDLHCVVFELPPDVPQSQALRELERDGRVESVQPLNSFRTLSTATDPYRRLQRNLDVMQVGQAHRWSRGENVRIAVVDTGIDDTHPDLAGRVILQRNFVDASAPVPPEQHGTAVAGVIAARANNREGITGVAPASSIVGLKACWPQDDNPTAAVCNTFTLAKALVAAVESKSHIVNLSLAGPADPLLKRLVEYGAKRGLIYVGALPPDELGFPCNLAHVICVGSAGRWQDGPQLFAPGDEVLTLIPAGRYDFLSGSSLAAASVSAGIALLRARAPDLTSEMALRLLAPTVTSAALDPAPSINVCRALARLLAEEGCN
ncbi:MAG TPA: S8 family serine peptidase [Steroidobacteraceae bacterium]